jgi:hypothetical protein
MAGKQKRQRLFDEFSENLRLCTQGEIQGQFVCPICLRKYESIDSLSDAHIFPKALGGRSYTLTCKDCNNNVGAKIESHEDKRVKLQNFFLGKGSHKALLSLDQKDSQIAGGRKVTAEMMILKSDTKTGLSFKVSKGKGFDPATEEKIAQLFGKEGHSLNVQIRTGVDSRKAEFTYLHAAFLFLFSQLGYEWALDPCTNIIRGQIQNPDQEIINFSKISLLASAFTDSLSNQKPQISWYQIMEPEESRGFLVVFSGFEHLGVPESVWMPFCGCQYEPPNSFATRVIPLEVSSGQHLSNGELIYSGYGLNLP